ncbi:MAG: DUF882 domain-containing protein [Geminicoccaceae bacterium]
MPEQATHGRLARRRFVLSLAAPITLAVAGMTPREAEAATRERSVQLHHCHTGEVFDTVYFADGRYLPEALRAATRHLRDWRDNTTHPIDPQLLDVLWSLRRSLNSTAPVQVFCGYRSPSTNAMLRRQHFGAARNSLHMQAMAVDLYIPNRPLRQVRSAAVRLKAGGVGYYPRSGFVHVDTGNIRYW